jgi:hypothetical protein
VITRLEAVRPTLEELFMSIVESGGGGMAAGARR